jgi:hypothetical protein
LPAVGYKLGRPVSLVRKRGVVRGGENIKR